MRFKGFHKFGNLLNKTIMKTYSGLSEQEIIALAITSGDDGARAYMASAR